MVVILTQTMPRVLAIGTDLHNMLRFRDILKGGGLNGFKTRRFGQRVLHPDHELPIFLKAIEKNDLELCNRILSVSWCVKEAIYKTLDPEDQKEFKMAQWYKINDFNGRPIIANSNYHKNEEFLCSITHDSDLVSAFVLRQE